MSLMILPQVHLRQPCYDFFFLQYEAFAAILQQRIHATHNPYQSEETTGGVYKRQGRIQHTILEHAYKGFLVQVRKLQQTIPFAGWNS